MVMTKGLGSGENFFVGSLWPRNTTEVLGMCTFFVMLIIGILLILAVYLRLEPQKKREIRWLVLKHGAAKPEDFETDYYHIGVWTPSDCTRVDMLLTNDTSYAWHKTGSKLMNENFRQYIYSEIGNRNLSGFRRYMVAGMGRSDQIQ